MEISVVGYRNVSFIDNSSGNQIIGKSYYFLYSDDNVVGYAPDKVFVRDGRFSVSPFDVGKRYNVSYDRRGRIDFSSVKEIV